MSGMILSSSLRIEMINLSSRRRNPRPPSRWVARASSSSSAFQPPSRRDDTPWSDDDRLTVTDAVVRSFLSSTTAPSTRKQQHPPKTTKSSTTTTTTTTAAPRPTLRATTDTEEVSAQKQVVGHLLSGGFDERLLAATPPHTLNWVIKTLGCKLRLDLAEQLYHWMRLRKLANEHSFVKLCEACEAARVPARAVLAWRNTSRLPTSFKLEERAAAALLKTFRPLGDLSGAVRILREFQNHGVPLNQYAFNIVIRIAADQGDVDTALTLAAQLRAHPTAKPDVRTFSGLLSALVLSERWPKTAVVHKLMQESGITPDSSLYLQLVVGYAGAGRPEAAEAVLDSMIDNGCRPSRIHWNALLSAYAQAKRYEGCVQAYTRMTEGAGLRPDGYSMVALLHGGAGARAGLTAASWVMGLMQRYEIPLSIEIGTAMIVCCRHAPAGVERRRSMEFANGMLSMLRSAGIAPNIRTYNSLMMVQADAEDYGGVRETLGDLERATEVEPNEATWSIALAAFQAAGWFDRAEQIEELRETWRTLHGR